MKTDKKITYKELMDLEYEETHESRLDIGSTIMFSVAALSILLMLSGFHTIFFVSVCFFSLVVAFLIIPSFKKFSGVKCVRCENQIPVFQVSEEKSNMIYEKAICRHCRIYFNV